MVSAVAAIAAAWHPAPLQPLIVWQAGAAPHQMPGLHYVTRWPCSAIATVDMALTGATDSTLAFQLASLDYHSTWRTQRTALEPAVRCETPVIRLGSVRR